MSAVRDQAEQHVYSQEMSRTCWSEKDGELMWTAFCLAMLSSLVWMWIVAQAFPGIRWSQSSFCLNGCFCNVKCFDCAPGTHHHRQRMDSSYVVLSINFISCAFLIFFELLSLHFDDQWGAGPQNFFMPINLDTSMSFLFRSHPCRNHFHENKAMLASSCQKRALFSNTVAKTRDSSSSPSTV